MPYLRPFKFIAFLVLLTLSCTLLAEPPRPVIPTPPATAQPFLPEGHDAADHRSGERHHAGH
jgi:hypothetical protein